MKLPRYKVLVISKRYGDYQVQAKNAKEAKLKAIEAAHKEHEVHWYGEQLIPSLFHIKKIKSL